MADDRVVQIADNSPEQVAFNLMEHIRAAERLRMDGIDRDWILDTYSQCLRAVRGHHGR